MPKIDWDTVETEQSREPVPQGTYLVCLTDVKADKVTKNGDEMWGLEFTIQEGPHKGRKLWDNMVFSKNAMPRVKYICSELGIETKGSAELEPIAIYKRKCWLTTIVEDFADAMGATKKVNRIPWNGYAKSQEAPAAGMGAKPVRDREDGVPF